MLHVMKEKRTTILAAASMLAQLYGAALFGLAGGSLQVAVAALVGGVVAADRIAFRDPEYPVRLGLAIIEGEIGPRECGVDDTVAGAGVLDRGLRAVGGRRAEPEEFQIRRNHLEQHVGADLKAASAFARGLQKRGHEVVAVRLYDVIYKLTEDVERAAKGLREPTYRQIREGKVEVVIPIKIPRQGVIAGSRVTEGKITRGGWAKLFRGKEQIFEGRISSLKHFKEDVREVQNGISFAFRPIQGALDEVARGVASMSSKMFSRWRITSWNASVISSGFTPRRATASSA